MSVDFGRRRSDVLAAVGYLDLDHVLVSNMLNVRYLTGFTGSVGYLLLSANPVLLVDARYREQAGEQASGVDIVSVDSSALLNTGLANMLDEASATRIGYEAQDLSAAKYLDLVSPNIDLIRTDNLVELRRTRKDEVEVALLRKAASLAIEILDMAWGLIKPGVLEAEIAGAIEQAQRTAGSEGSAAKLIVASGPRTSLPHAAASMRPIGRDEPVLIDISTVWEGYRADITRLGFTGPVPAEYSEIVDVVGAAQDNAIAELRPGMTASQVDSLIRGVVEEKGFGPQFIHASGHGIGMGQHELPMFNPYHDTPVEPGMVVMFEPGIYIEGKYGARLEDAVVVTEEGCDVLMPAGREIRQI